MESNPVPAQPQPVASTQTTPPAAGTPQAPVPPQQPTQAANVVTDQKAAGGSKKMLWILLALVVLILVGGAGFMLMNRGEAETPKPATSTTSLEDLNNLKAQLETTADEGDLEADLTALDKDLQELQ